MASMNQVRRDIARAERQGDDSRAKYLRGVLGEDKQRGNERGGR